MRGFACLLGSLGFVLVHGHGKYVVADVNDPLVAKTSDAFLKEYDLFISDLFAVVPEKKILNTYVYQHPMEVNKDEEDEDAVYEMGFTYKLNVLYKLTWDSPTFPSRPYATVGYCVYACAKDEGGNITCESKEFNQLKREEKPLNEVNVRHLQFFINRYLHHTYDDAHLRLTAYEVQHDKSTDDKIEYVEFQVEEEPVKCQAVIFNNGTTTAQSMLYFDDICFKATYQGISLLEFQRRQHADVGILIIGMVLFITTTTFLVVYRRNLFSTKNAYRKLHIRFGTGGPNTAL